jgi:hypothetical protein
MDINLIKMLKTSAKADKSKAILTLNLLGNNGVGIGDHSTKDFYSNAEEALRMLIDADDRLKAIKKYFKDEKEVPTKYRPSEGPSNED